MKATFRPERVEYLRMKKGLSQEKLLRTVDLDITLATWHNWLSGKYKPSAECLAQLAVFFGVDVGYFFDINNDMTGHVNQGKKK